MPYAQVARTLKDLLGRDRGAGRSPRELLHEVLGHLVERLYFADFRVAQQTVLVGETEISQLLALKTAGGTEPGLVVVTRLGQPDALLAPARLHRGDLPRALWALLAFTQQVEAAALVDDDRFTTPLGLLLTSGPPWLAGRNAIETLSSSAGPPRWALVTAPTACGAAARHPGTLRVRLRPSEALASTLAPRLGGPEVVATSLELGPDPDGLTVFSVVQRLAVGGASPCTVHDLVLRPMAAAEDAAQQDVPRTLRVILSADAASLPRFGPVEEVPDGAMVGPDLRPLLGHLCAGLARLREADLRPRLVSFGRDDLGEVAVVALHLAHRDARGACLSAAAAALGGDAGFAIEADEEVPALASSANGALAGALAAAGAAPVAYDVAPSEAGIFADASVETWICGPGKENDAGRCSIDDGDLERYRAQLESLYARLLLTS